MELSQYLLKLKQHDWEFNFSDDSRVYAKGAKERRELSEAHAKLDPDSVHWNSIAPERYKRAT